MNEKYFEILRRLYPDGKTLYLECRGMNDDNIPGDVKNYRVNVVGLIDIAYQHKVYRNMYIEFCGGHETYYYRHTHKITGQPLKKAVKELKNVNGLHIDTSYPVEEFCNGCVYNASYRLSVLEN